ncbi:MAG: hypothetical protein NZ602_13710 [Thermoguttaceae bacterium]|nr:hypothetical protein [Thermoguttaceae bacterium]MDW8037136.1 hypothetical protein [Thermoguttaceae bacterium]
MASDPSNCQGEPISRTGKGEPASRTGKIVTLLAIGLLLGSWGSMAGCTAFSASYWGKSGGGFVRLFGDTVPPQPSRPATVSEWMAQPRPQP